MSTTRVRPLEMPARSKRAAGAEAAPSCPESPRPVAASSAPASASAAMKAAMKNVARNLRMRVLLRSHSIRVSFFEFRPALRKGNAGRRNDPGHLEDFRVLLVRQRTDGEPRILQELDLPQGAIAPQFGESDEPRQALDGPQVG